MIANLCHRYELCVNASRIQRTREINGVISLLSTYE